MESLHNQEFHLSIRYPVLFTREVFDAANSTLRRVLTESFPGKKSRILFVLDSGLVEKQPDLVDRISSWAGASESFAEMVDSPLVIQGGEGCKNDRSLFEQLLADLQSRRMDRHSILAVVGGGALQDMAGFAASITHRGVRVLRLPSTVLSQNDSGVGVKNGINAFGQKNYLGSFSPPFAVINDFAFLKTLPGQVLRTGVSEAVKVALIRDPDFFSWLESHAEELARTEESAMHEMIHRSALLHMNHIATSGDPYEQGSARPLDFGHWSAHKLELLSDHRLSHGEAVAIGILLDSRYSFLTGLLDEESFARILNLLSRLDLPGGDPALFTRDASGKFAVLQGLEEFREHLGGELTLILLQGIGRPVEVHSVDQEKLLASMEWLRVRYETMPEGS